MKDYDLRVEIMARRIEKNMSQSALAQAIGTSQKSVSMWENGESVPRKTARIKLAKFFGLPLDYFMPDDILEDGVEEDDLSNDDNDSLVNRSINNPKMLNALKTLIDHYGDEEIVIEKILELKNNK